MIPLTEKNLVYIKSSNRFLSEHFVLRYMLKKGKYVDFEEIPYEEIIAIFNEVLQNVNYKIVFTHPYKSKNCKNVTNFDLWDNNCGQLLQSSGPYSSREEAEKSCFIKVFDEIDLREELDTVHKEIVKKLKVREKYNMLEMSEIESYWYKKMTSV